MNRLITVCRLVVYLFFFFSAYCAIPFLIIVVSGLFGALLDIYIGTSGIIMFVFGLSMMPLSLVVAIKFSRFLEKRFPSYF